MVRDDSLYALYKGERLIMVATPSEVAEHEGVQRTTAMHWAKPSYLKRIAGSKNRKVMIKLEEDHDMEETE